MEDDNWERDGGIGSVSKNDGRMVSELSVFSAVHGFAAHVGLFLYKGGVGRDTD